jgi:hypothetical protein
MSGDQLDTQCVDHSRARSWLLFSVGVVRKKRGKQRSPFFHHANQCSFGEDVVTRLIKCLTQPRLFTQQLINLSRIFGGPCRQMG